MNDTQPSPDNAALARRAKTVGLVIAGTMILWMIAQFVGGRMGLPGRLAFLIDLIALVALIWAMFATNRIRKDRRRR